MANIYPTELSASGSLSYQDLEANRWLKLTGFMLLDEAIEATDPKTSSSMVTGITIMDII